MYSMVGERKEDNRKMQRSLHIMMPMAGEGNDANGENDGMVTQTEFAKW